MLTRYLTRDENLRRKMDGYTSRKKLLIVTLAGV
jgi:hypothetical protein